MTGKLTQAQIDRLLVSLNYGRQHAYRRQTEYRWWIPVLVLLVCLLVIVASASALPGGW